MIGWVIYDSEQFKTNSWFANKLLEYIRTFCDARLIICERLQYGISERQYYLRYDNKSVEKPDFVLMRSIYPLLSFFFEQLGIRVFNNHQTSAICNDKRLTYLSVKKSAISIMNTLFFDRKFFLIDDINKYQFKYPVVLKSVAGHGGKEVFLIQNSDDLYKTVSTLESSEFLIQKVFYPYGHDLRVYVLGDRIIGSVLRSSDGLKSNYSLGGKAYYYKLNRSQQNIVTRIIQNLSFHPDFIGIDFFYSRDQLVFNEIEDVVGTRMLYDTSEIDAAFLYAQYIKEKTMIES